MAKCGCRSRRCACSLSGDGGISVGGNGSARMPYLPRWSLPTLVGVDTDQADITITGTGTTGDPWVISIDTLGGSVMQTVYTADDTWAKGGGTVAHVVAIGGGGGGGSAGPGAPAGGSGGSGSAMSVDLLLLSDLADFVDLKVGQGGAGGRPVSGLTTAADGGDSWFGEHLYAPGGRGGKSQAGPAQTALPTLGGTPPEGGPGGAGRVRNGPVPAPADDHLTFFSPTGGGMGSGTVVAGSTNCDIPGLLAMKSWGGEGGRGGNTSVIGPSAYPGEDGGLYGGGGGGGASVVGASWAGGSGAPGVVVVTVW